MLQTRKSRNKGIPQSIFESLTQVKKEILAQESLQEESKTGDFTRTLKILEKRGSLQPKAKSQSSVSDVDYAVEYSLFESHESSIAEEKSELPKILSNTLK